KDSFRTCRFHNERKIVPGYLLLEGKQVLFGHIECAREHQCISSTRSNCVDVPRFKLFVRIEFGHVYPVFPFHINISNTYVVYQNKPVLRAFFEDLTKTVSGVRDTRDDDKLV